MVGCGLEGGRKANAPCSLYTVNFLCNIVHARRQAVTGAGAVRFNNPETKQGHSPECSEAHKFDVHSKRTVRISRNIVADIMWLVVVKY
jgi:hypothetical protein